MKYDVFISYRRDGGSEFARSVKAMLERRGYSVFLDFDELKDGVFDERILKAIESAPVFLFILSQHSLDRCTNEDDWVRKEIEYAYKSGRHIIPVNKNGSFEGLPEGLPEPLATVLGRNQYSEVMIGQLFEASMNKMIKDRIAPVVKRPARKKASRIFMSLACVAVLVLAGVFMAGNAKAHQDVVDYESLLVHADSLMLVEDSVQVALECIKGAEDLAHEYEDTRFSGLFGTDAVAKHRELDHIIDSLFILNRNYVDFYMESYRNSGDAEDKKKALKYLDKALALKDDADLSTMRRILK